MNPISEQRRFLNEFLIPEFKQMLRPDSIVCDIGKTEDHPYASMFREFTYVTLDRNPAKKPTILIDMEHNRPPISADGILFNGVFEQCDDPFSIWRNILSMLNPGGIVLAGLAGIGMTPYGSSDKWRVTKDGAQLFVRPLTIISTYDLPEYHYVIARKD